MPIPLDCPESDSWQRLFTDDVPVDLLGSVLYAMGTGKPPFHGSTALAVLRQANSCGCWAGTSAICTRAVEGPWWTVKSSGPTSTSPPPPGPASCGPDAHRKRTHVLGQRGGKPHLSGVVPAQAGPRRGQRLVGGRLHRPRPQRRRSPHHRSEGALRNPAPPGASAKDEKRRVWARRAWGPAAPDTPGGVAPRSTTSIQRQDAVAGDARRGPSGQRLHGFVRCFADVLRLRQKPSGQGGSGREEDQVSPGRPGRACPLTRWGSVVAVSRDAERSAGRTLRFASRLTRSAGSPRRGAERGPARSASRRG